MNITSINFKKCKFHKVWVTFQGSRDNMSIVVVAFEGAPKPTPEAIKQDMDLDEKIETKIKGTTTRSFKMKTTSTITRKALCHKIF